MQHIHAEFGFEIGFVLSGNSSGRHRGNQFWH